MTFKSFANKYGKTSACVAAIFLIVDYMLKWLELIPPIIGLIVLILATILVIPALSKIKSGSKSYKAVICSIAILIFIGFGYHFISGKSKADQVSITTADNHLTTNFKTSVSNNTSVYAPSNNSIQDVNNKKNNVEINAPITTSGNSQLTIANEINYNNLPQRHLNSVDLKKLKTIPMTHNRIRVLCPPNNNEAIKYADEIFNKIFDLGYKNISRGITDKSLKSSQERFSILYNNEPEYIITIAINPQQ